MRRMASTVLIVMAGLAALYFGADLSKVKRLAEGRRSRWMGTRGAHSDNFPPVRGSQCGKKL
jgi:hypothetical protein